LQAQVRRVNLEKKFLAISEKISRRRNRRSGLAEGNSEIPTTIRSGKVAHGLSLSVQGRSPGVIGI
jgi:hypothetical protein